MLLVRLKQQLKKNLPFPRIESIRYGLSQSDPIKQRPIYFVSLLTYYNDSGVRSIGSRLMGSFGY